MNTYRIKKTDGKIEEIKAEYWKPERGEYVFYIADDPVFSIPVEDVAIFWG